MMPISFEMTLGPIPDKPVELTGVNFKAGNYLEMEDQAKYDVILWFAITKTQDLTSH
jgi:hypothetical protein